MKKINYHYSYTVDFDKKYIKEYQVKDNEKDPEGIYLFPLYSMWL